MKNFRFVSRVLVMKLVVFGIVCILGCSAPAPATAQSSQSQFKVITPGTPFFAVSGDWYQVTVRAGTLTAYTGGDSDTEMEIWDISAKRLAYDDDSGTDKNARISITVPAGTFFIRIGYAGGSGRPYVLNVDRQ